MNRWGHANTDHRWLNVPDEQCGRYNLWDVWWDANLVPHLLRDAADLGQLEWWNAHGAGFQESVLAMAHRGLAVDGLALAQTHNRVEDELHQTDSAIRAAADAAGFSYTEKFPNSRDQVSRFLFDTLQLKPAKRTEKKGRPKVDQEALTTVLRNLRVRDEPHRQVLFDLFHRTRLHTVLTRYLNLEPDADGRVRPVVKLSHVKTLRLAYANPALQQFPDEARHVFVAKPGHVFISADYSQLEARLLAYYADDTPSIEAFDRGEDIHAVNARDLFNLSREQWDALVTDSLEEPYRTYAKTGFLYRMMYGGTAASGDKKLFCPCPRCAHRMPSTMRLNTADSVRAEERWHARHPNVKHFQREVSLDVRRTHRFPMLLGGYRYLSAPPSRDLERELKNIPMQSGGARLMIRAQNELHRAGAPIVLQHHDSFLEEVPETEVPRWAALTREVMERPVEVGRHKPSIPVDLKVGRNWGRYSASNPKGLKKYTGEMGE